MKTFFEIPEIEVQKFSAMEDVLTASGDDENALPEDEF
jgi:hypothetical protein